MKKGYLDHTSLGRVIVTVNPRARRFVARWKGQQLHLTSPAVGDIREIHEALDHMAPNLVACRPPTRPYAIGTRMDFDFFSITFTLHPESLSIQSRLSHEPDGTPLVTIALGSALDPCDPEHERFIAKHLCQAARFFAYKLTDEAQAISQRLGVYPAGWTQSHGSTRLGTCGTDRVISLSYMCAFLPARLREYIVCHELAHLTHFDHSPAFHALCSLYCGGDGDARRAELKSFRWPVPRR